MDVTSKLTNFTHFIGHRYLDVDGNMKLYMLANYIAMCVKLSHTPLGTDAGRCNNRMQLHWDAQLSHIKIFGQIHGNTGTKIRKYMNIDTVTLVERSL